MHNIDNLDQQILRVLTKDARTPYAEMAKNFGVSPGTIHVRVEKMRQSGVIDEVVEAYYTTGNYSIFIKVMTHTIAELHLVLSAKIQLIDEIQSTETLISMQNPILRDIQP